MENSTIAASNVVQQSSDYDKFVLLNQNRDVNRGHVEAIKKSFEEHGNLTEVQPVLVNERHEIIDGQHRFIACRDLGLPIFYTVVSGIGIGQARSMNILHRNWKVTDFAKSYAAEGRRSYINYNILAEEYPELSHSILLQYAHGGRKDGLFALFRNGEFVLGDLGDARKRLDMLSEMIEITPVFKNKATSLAFLRMMKHEDYDHETFKRKLGPVADDLRSYQNVDDNVRQLETIYNRGRQLENYTRFF